MKSFRQYIDKVFYKIIAIATILISIFFEVKDKVNMNEPDYFF